MAELFEAVAGARAALRELPGRGLIRATGADRVRFLNGMLTADVAKLEPGAAAPAPPLNRNAPGPRLPARRRRGPARAARPAPPPTPAPPPPAPRRRPRRAPPGPPLA